ncbi:MAG: VWA domain-containing protein [Campylobacterota bacterium]|nr:VWA domain-containing protein [Campylobacterota bacterium]
MNWLSFEYPWMVFLLFPLLYCLYKCKDRLVPSYFVHLHLFALKKPWVKLEWLVKVLILIALIVALASPILVDRSDPLNRQGIDIVLCLDGSGSMNASGFEAGTRRSRFEVVQEIASTFVMKRLEDNVGVVLYGDFAFIASPVTYEKEIVAEMIGYLSHGMAGQNTAIGDGVAMSLRALERSKAASKVIILLTDGEHNSGRISPKEAEALAAEKGVVIYSIGIGKAGEFDEALLKTMAEGSGGRSFVAHNSEALSSVYSEIDTLERSKIKSKAYLKKSYFYTYALLMAFVLMLYYLWRRR